MSSVFITNVDDYLAPSQACINPLFVGDSKDEKKQPDSAPNNGTPVVKRRVVRRRRKPVVANDASIPSGLSSVASVESSTPASQQPDTTTTKKDTGFSLADCLACSGCVTTAETVLVEQHSLSTLKTKCQEALAQNKEVAITMSPASLADLMRALQITSDFQSWTRRLTCFLHETCHASLVLDGKIPLEYSLTEAAHEFCHVFQQENNEDAMNVVDDEEQQENGIPADTPSVAISATQTRYVLPNGESRLVHHDSGRRQYHCKKQSFPLLTSSCPALVCLVEKNTPNAVSHLTSTKSPMAIAGTLFKQCLKDNCLHVAVMPCHDKKLEASRKDLMQKDETTHDTDLVITTQELHQLLQEQTTAKTQGSNNVASPQDIRTYLETFPLAPIQSEWDFDPHSFVTTSGPVLVSRMGTNGESYLNGAGSVQKDDSSANKFFPFGSGGYADFVFKFAAQHMFGCHLTRVEWKPVVSPRKSSRQSARVVASRRKNVDFYQAVLYKHSDGTYSCHQKQDDCQTVLRFATAYGLQNIQRVLQPFKDSNKGSNTDTSPYHYVEAMACPSGCLNGGGQVRDSTSGAQPLQPQRETPTETRMRVRDTQHVMMRTTNGKEPSSPTANGQLNNSGIYRNSKLVPDGPFGNAAQRLLHTRFHIVPPLQTNTSNDSNNNAMVIDTRW